MANTRALATAGLLLTLASGTSIATSPQDMAEQAKSCKALSDDKQRLKCFDHLFGDTHDLLGANGETLVHKASAVRLHAPHPNGARIACAGGNFADHLAGMAAMGLLPGAGAMSIDEAATRIRESGIWGFWKVGRAAASPGADVPYPGRADRLDYEGEVAIVLGKQGKDVRAADAGLHPDDCDDAPDQQQHQPDGRSGFEVQKSHRPPPGVGGGPMGPGPLSTGD